MHAHGAHDSMREGLRAVYAPCTSLSLRSSHYLRLTHAEIDLALGSGVTHHKPETTILAELMIDFFLNLIYLWYYFVRFFQKRDKRNKINFQERLFYCTYFYYKHLLPIEFLIKHTHYIKIYKKIPNIQTYKYSFIIHVNCRITG